MTWWTIRPNNNRSNIHKLQDVGCTSNYINTKTEIEQKIDRIPNNNTKLFCSKCIELKNYTIQRSNGLQYCYDLKKFQRIEDTDKIKEFIDKCPDPPKCRYPPNKPVRKPDVSKGQESDSCTGHGKCKEKIVTQVEPKSKAASGITAGISQSRRSEVKASLKEDPGHSNGDELKDGKVILQNKPEVNPPGDPVRTQDERSKSTFNQHSVSTEKTVTPTPHVSSPATFTSTELGTTPSAISSQNSLTIDSHSSSSTQVEGLNKDVPTTNLAGVHTEGVNKLQNIPVDAQITHGSANDKADAFETSVETVSGTTSPRVEEAIFGEPRSEGTSVRVISDQIGDAVVDQGNPDIRVPQIIVAHNGDLGSRDESHGITTSENIHHTKHSDVDTTSVEVPGSELTDDDGDKSGIFNQIFNTMRQNKENVIKTSMPMGIVLLLSLLFKYTPLWRILTKRKRNKRSHMNEKLQRVLQQPSTGSETKSIPFSYSAFEYSSE
ncbi:unnamed protein product [Plasmodium vivax]|uniref:(malaria parasite P. vivax) hypothetical protein n=1 Tax=Plasmodium vivax TaxID=5855 RepID=A0A8S4H222_PLAVI|nr:unnamed protein product [Plasmodium vivax]